MTAQKHFCRMESRQHPSHQISDDACLINSLTIVGYLLEVFFLGYGYLRWSVFPPLLGASTGNLSQSFFEPFSVGSQP